MRTKGAPQGDVRGQGAGGAQDGPERRLHLREMRELAGLKQCEVAAIVGVNPRTYGAWERGTNDLPSKRVWDLCSALGCTPDDLFGFDGSERSPRMTLVADETIDLYERFKRVSPNMRHIIGELMEEGTKSHAR